MTLTADDTRTGFGDVAFSPDGTRIVTGTFGGTAIIWRAGLDATAEAATLPAAAFTQGAAQFTQDGKQLLATSGDGNIAVWDVATWQQERTLGPTQARPGPPCSASPWPPRTTRSDSPRVLTASSSPPSPAISSSASTRSYPCTTSTAEQTASTSTSADGSATCTGRPTGSCSHSPAATATASASSGSSTGRVARCPRSSSRTGSSTPPDSRSDDAHLVVTHSTHQARTLLGPAGSRCGTGAAVNWSTRSTSTRGRGPAPDRATRGDRSAGRSRRPDRQHLELRDRTTRRRPRRPQRHRRTGSPSPTTVGDSPRRTATGRSESGTPGPDNSSWSCAGTPDSWPTCRSARTARWLASYGAEGTVRVWALDLDELAEIARQRVTRNLTESECTRYLRQTACGGA